MTWISFRRIASAPAARTSTASMSRLEARKAHCFRDRTRSKPGEHAKRNGASIVEDLLRPALYRGVRIHGRIKKIECLGRHCEMRADGIADGPVQRAKRVEDFIRAVARSEAREIMIAPEITHTRRKGSLLVEADQIVARRRDADQAVRDLAISRREA